MSEETTEPNELEPAGDQAAALFVQPTAADNRPRTAPAKPPAVPVDPEAPFGWMNDPSAPGGRRPKKAPGRGRSAAPREATPPPANRKANKPRTVSSSTSSPSSPSSSTSSGTPQPTRSYADMAGEVADTLWMVSAATPVTGGKVLGVPLQNVTLRIKAQGAILKDQKPSLVQGVSVMAEHSPPVARGLQWIAGDGGPGWILPACMALVPFVLASLEVWRDPVNERTIALAQRTADDFRAMAQNMGLIPADTAPVDHVDQAAAPALALVPNG